MARHSQPREVAEVKGLVKHNPQRYEDFVPKSGLPFGDPPEQLSERAKALWFEYSSYAPPGVLTASERLIFMLLCTLLEEWEADPKKFPAAKIGHLIGCAARLGMSPADRQKLGMDKPPEEENPYAKKPM